MKWVWILGFTPWILFAQESRLDRVSLDHFKTSDTITVKPLSSLKNEKLLEIELSKITAKRDLTGKSLESPFVYGAIRDSKMLNTDIGAMADFYNWTESSIEGHLASSRMSDDRTLLMGRCWAIAVYNLYAYFYGTQWTGKSSAITQDEIAFWGKIYEKNKNEDLGDSINNVFEIGTASGSGIETVAYLINFVFEYDKAKRQNELTFRYIEEQLRQEKPIPISHSKYDGDHFSLIVGLATDMNGDTLARIANVDNYGSVMYAPVGKILESTSAFVSYEIPTKFRRTDSLYAVNMDSDGDGVCDFDENYRFHTDVNKTDSDEDGITDFNEIYSYTIRNPISVRSNVKFKSSGFIDADHDSLRPEKDKDSDNDGLMDGEEDANRNGIFESEMGESDPYAKETDAVMDVPWKFAFYARRYLALNDGSICYQGSRGCVVASEGELNEDAVNIGARSVLDTIYAKGGNVWVRDAADVYGIYMYNDGLSYKNQNNPIRIQGSAKVTNSVFPSNKAWNFNREFENELSGFSVAAINEKIISSGKQDTIQNGDSLKLLKVESGAVLYIDCGEIYVENIYLESGASIAFLNPGYSTILHLNGDVIWRASIVTSEDSVTKIEERQLIAKGFKIVQHKNVTMNIEGEWSGTIFAPSGNLILGQTEMSKTIYGRFLANYISVHQRAKVYAVAFDPLRFQIQSIMEFI